MYIFNEDLEPDILTDKEVTKTIPCRVCSRACIVTTFMAPAKVECTTCRKLSKEKRNIEVQIRQAEKADPSSISNLMDSVINQPFRRIPLCPCDPDHSMELKYVSHTPNYGPRHLTGYDKKGTPLYTQETGESITYQCLQCNITVSYSTQHPQLMRQNEARIGGGSSSTLAAIQGVRTPTTPEIYFPESLVDDSYNQPFDQRVFDND